MMESAALKQLEKALKALYIQVPDGVADDIWKIWTAAKKDIDVMGETIAKLSSELADLEREIQLGKEQRKPVRPSITDINNHNPDKFKNS